MTVPVPLRLRPLEIGDLLDETFRLYRRHFLLFAGISVILAVPSAALFSLGFAALTAAAQANGGVFDSTGLGYFLASFGAALVIGILILPFTNTAVLYAACESAQGRPVTASAVFAGVGRRYFPLLAYWLVFNAYTAYLALILCVAPLVLWIWGFIGWVVVPPVLLVERIGLGAAFSRSWQLVQGRWWRTFLIVFLLLLIWFLVDLGLGAFINLAQSLLSVFVSPFLATVVSTAGGQLVGALANPILQIAVALIYFDLRVRKEALDLFQMANQLAAQQAAT